MRFAGLLLVFWILVLVLPVSGDEVSLSTPQKDYYFPAGEEAAIPLTIVSTYDHDITGTLKKILIPMGTPGSGTSDASVQTRDFSAFTEERTVSIPAGRSDIPGDYVLTILFSYPEEGGRMSALGDIRIHFVTSIENAPVNKEPVTSTDTIDPTAGTSSEGSSSQEEAPAENEREPDPSAELQNSQMAQDTSSLQKQLAQESNESGDLKDELLRYIRGDPLVYSLDRSLAGAGFTLNTTSIIPVSNQSGRFVLRYSSGPANADIAGVLQDTRVLFAEESSTAPVPLPGLLLNNTSFQEYTRRVAENEFVRSGTRINVTPVMERVNLTYSNANNRILRMNANIENGTVVSFDGESPENPLAEAVPALAFASVILISAGIWYLIRTYRRDVPVPVVPLQEKEPGKTSREIAGIVLDEAEKDAARGAWPEAYRKTGRAIRIMLLHENPCGDALTIIEVEHILGAFTGDRGKIRGVLERCQMVGYAKDSPHPDEFTDIICFARTLLDTDI